MTQLPEIFRLHDTVMLEFSGGKDSLAVLHLCREWWSRLYVVWVNPGSPLPEQVEYMAEIGRTLPRFLEVTADQPGDIGRSGWPTDVVPVYSTAHGRQWREGSRVEVRSFVDCCTANLWTPMRNAAKAIGATAVLRGQKAADTLRASITDGHVEDGITFYLPVENWSDEQVMRFLDERGVTLMKPYLHGVRTSFDCWNCTAYGLHAKERFDYLRAYHPQKWSELLPTLKAMRDDLNEQAAHFYGIEE